MDSDGDDADDDKDGSSHEADANDDAKGRRAKTKKSQGKRVLVDVGTLYGFLSQASRNDQRAFAALREGKTFLAKVLAEAPGFDLQALNELYDRDEVSNAVMTAGSRFQMDQPWVVFLALHLEEARSLFGGSNTEKDSGAVFWKACVSRGIAHAAAPTSLAIGVTGGKGPTESFWTCA